MKLRTEKKNMQEQLDQLLEGIRNSKPPSGLEQDIMRHLARTSQAQHWWCRSWNPTVRWTAWLMPTLTGLVILAVHIERQHRTGASHGTEVVRTPQFHALSTNFDPITSLTAQQKEASRVATRFPAHNSLRASAHLLRATHPGPAHSHVTRETVSFPAPPAPLSEQERILLSIAKKAEPEQIALLDSRCVLRKMSRTAMSLRTSSTEAVYEPATSQHLQIDHRLFLCVPGYQFSTMPQGAGCRTKPQPPSGFPLRRITCCIH